MSCLTGIHILSFTQNIILGANSPISAVFSKIAAIRLLQSDCISTELSDDMIVIYIFMKKIEFTVRKAPKPPFLPIYGCTRETGIKLP